MDSAWASEYQRLLKRYIRYQNKPQRQLPMPAVWQIVEKVYSSDTGISEAAIAELKADGLEGFVTFLDRRIPYDQRDYLPSFSYSPPGIDMVQGIRPDLYPSKK